MTLYGHQDWVSSVSFSPDGTKLFSDAMNYDGDFDERCVWNLATSEKTIVASPPPWVKPTKHRHGNLLVLRDDEDILVVDTSPSLTEGLQAHRAAKALTDPWWHREQAEASESKRDSYSALFHRAWQLKSQPNDAFAAYRLHTAQVKMARGVRASRKGIGI